MTEWMSLFNKVKIYVQNMMEIPLVIKWISFALQKFENEHLSVCYYSIFHQTSADLELLKSILHWYFLYIFLNDNLRI